AARRDSATLERAPRRHVVRRPATDPNALLHRARAGPAGLLAAARRQARPDRLRAGAARLRDLDGREARTRPRVDRRPLRAPVPAHRPLHRLPRAPPDANRASLDSSAMCGICGIASGRDAVDRDRLARMASILEHRGPDSEGMHLDGTIGLAARRLAIIDLTGGDQPIANEDGTVVVGQNGDIYNYRELTR